MWRPNTARRARAVTVADLTSFAKLLVQGRDAEAALQRLCANDVAVPVGTTVYTGLLNARGTYESDLTVARLAPDRFLLVTGTAQATRDADWIRAQPRRTTRTSRSPTSLGLRGARRDGAARARSAARLTKAPLDQRGVPVRRDPRDRHRLRERCSPRAVPMWASWAGSFTCRSNTPARSYDALMDAGAESSARAASATTRSSRLRLEKGYRAWGRELTPDYNPYEAGLSFAVKLDKATSSAATRCWPRRATPPVRRLLSFVATSPDTPIAHGGELILRDGEPAGEVTSAAYGHTVGGIVALGYATTGRRARRRGVACGKLRDRHRGRPRAGAREPQSARTIPKSEKLKG